MSTRPQSVFMAAGTYGCAFSPPVPYILDTKDPLGGVVNAKKVNAKVTEILMKAGALGKVYKNNEEVEDEWKMAKRLYKIDPESVSFAYPLLKTKVEVADFKRAKDYSKCINDVTLAKRRFYELEQTIMPNRGETLVPFFRSQSGKLPLGASSRVDLARVFLPAFRALDKLISSRLVHQDLKWNNIVANEKGMWLIDFGLMVGFDDFANYVKNDNLTFPNGYYVNPPEYRLMQRNYKSVEAAIIDERYVYRHTLNQESFDFYFRMTPGTEQYNDYKALIDDLYNTPAEGTTISMKTLMDAAAEKRVLANFEKWNLDELKKKRPDDSEKIGAAKGAFNKANIIADRAEIAAMNEKAAWFKPFAEKADIFSLGLIIVEFYKIYPMPRAQEKDIGLEFLAIIRDMLSFNPNKRPNIKELLKRVEALVATNTQSGLFRYKGVADPVIEQLPAPAPAPVPAPATLGVEPTYIPPVEKPLAHPVRSPYMLRAREIPEGLYKKLAEAEAVMKGIDALYTGRITRRVSAAMGAEAQKALEEARELYANTLEEVVKLEKARGTSSASVKPSGRPNALASQLRALKLLEGGAK